MRPTPEQQRAVDLFAAGQRLAIEAGAGCLAGSTMIHVNRAGKGSRMTIEHVARRLAGERHPARAWDLSIPTRVACADDGVVRLGEIADAWHSGEQEVYEVTTVAGRVIRATERHPFLTGDGWAMLRDLAPGSTVAVNTGRSQRGRGPKRQYRSRYTRHHPHQTRRSRQRERFSVAEHRLVVEAEINDLALDEYLSALRAPTPPVGLVFLDPAVHVHHRDGDPVNNARGNLVVMSEAEHHRLHAAEGDALNVLWQVGSDVVASVRPVGVEPTYDLSMRVEPHNFIANGFVVHNTGKTSTLQMIARSTDRIGAYVAFNRAIVNEAREKMPMNVTSSTAHALAMRQVGGDYRHRLDGDRVPSSRLARMLDVGALVVTKPDGSRKVLQPAYLAGLVMRAIRSFCASDAAEPGPSFVPYIDAIDARDARGARTYRNNDLVRRELAGPIERAWADLSDPVGRLPFTHDHYLKLWELGDEPRIPGEFILFDEAQDASPVMLSAVAKNAARGAQVIFVGDSQQQIYCQPAGTAVRVPVKVGGGRGRGGPRYEHREVPIESLAVGDRVVTYTGAPRLGRIRKSGCAVSGVTVRPYEGRLISVTSESGRSSRYTPEHHCVAMVGDALAGRHVVYLMRRGTQYRIGRAPWRYSTQHSIGPHQRALAEGADAWWLLSDHESPAEAGLAEAIAQHRYGLPSWRFATTAGDLVDRDKFWAQVGDNSAAAQACLAAHGRLIDEPLWQRGVGRQAMIRRPIVTAAANLVSGMRVLVADTGTVEHNRSDEVRTSRWETVAVAESWWSGEVVSISVENDHTYVADGIVTHNSWRGAVNALASVPADARSMLTQSFRFGPAIAEVANVVLDALDADLRLVGLPSIPSRVEGVAHPAAILCRSNSGAVSTVLALQKAGRHPHLVGGATDVVRFAKAVGELQETGRTWHPDLACFDSWGEVRAYCLAPGARLLAPDLTWTPIEHVVPGDRLLAFDEHVGPGRSGRAYVEAAVESARALSRPCRRLRFDDGSEVIASVEHRWLTKTTGNNVRWQTTERLTIGAEVVSIGRPWEREETHDAGWLAGMWDGEGCLSTRSKGTGNLSLAQREGPVLDRAELLMKERGFDFRRSVNKSGVGHLTMRGGLPEKMRLLGTLRPERLLAGASGMWAGSRVEARRRARLVEVEDVGEQEVIAVGTTAGTFIAEGLLSHNCADDPQGDDLALMVKLVDEYGVQIIVDALDGMIAERNADVVVSTAHKSKGREWASVRLAGDFIDPERMGEGGSGEWRLLYVGVTRAQAELDVRLCEPVDRLVSGSDRGKADPW